MKHLAILTIVLFLFGCKGLNYLSKDITINDKEKLDYLMAMFPSDSGHICSKKGVDFLLMNHLTDTLNTGITLSDIDTIGRYYKDKNYQVIFCIVDNTSKISYQNNLLFQFNLSTKHLHIERYCNYSWHSQCWNNGFDGFERKGELYCYLNCPTPIGQYALSDIYLFKNVQPQQNLNYIPKSAWFMLMDANDTTVTSFTEKDLDSEIEVTSDSSVIMHYTFEVNQLDTAFEKIKTIQLEKFDVLFKLKNNSWFTLDSNKIRDIDL